MYSNIQALRGIAALLVVLHHSAGHFRAMGLSNFIFESIAKFGYLGVDVFFVISGFVMAKTTADIPNNLTSSKQFMTKRLLRIYLGYLPIFFLALIYFYFFDVQYLAKKEIIQSMLLINPNMFDLVITPAWSLTYELYFYVIVALLVLTKQINPKLLFTLLLLSVLIKNFVIDLGRNPILDFFFSSLLFEFICGYLLFMFFEKFMHKNLIYLTIPLTVVFLLIAVYLNIGYGYVRVLTFGVFAISLVWSFLIMEKNQIFVFHGIFTRIGDASYTLYLTHTILLGMFYTLGLRDYLVKIDFALIGFVIYIMFIIIFSFFFYKTLELPLYLYFKKKWA